MLSKVISKTRSWFEKNAVNKAINKALITMYFKKNVTGSICVWEGASQFDGLPIQVILSGYSIDSTNTKTGAMIQVYILPKNNTPYEVYTESKPTVCGSCKYLGGGCYVRWSNLGNIQKSGNRNFADLDLGQNLCAGLRVRVGAAGDPAAVPLWVWEHLLQDADGFTGYTHAWRDYPEYKKFFVASTDSKQETDEALEQGWSPFYVVEDWEEAPQESFQCLSSKQKNMFQNYTCIECMKCHGGKTPKVIVEKLHGATSTISQAKIARGK